MTESEKYKASIRITKKATKEDAERLSIEIGQDYTIIPEPKTRAELFERFRKLTAQRLFEAQQRLFKKKYGNGSEKNIIDELIQLNSFIDEANKLSTTETFENKMAGKSYERDLQEYSRLANGYYENPSRPFFVYSFYNSNAAIIYGKYFLYKDWLENKLRSILDTSQEENIDLKNHLIEIIRNAENMAKETLEISIKQDYFQLNKLKINNEHGNKLLSILISATIEEYYNIRNLYKASNEQFEFINNEPSIVKTIELDDNDRLDFIAINLIRFIDWQPEDKKGIADKMNAIEQIENLEKIVFDTKTLELKKAAYVKSLEQFKIKKETHQSNEDKPDEVKTKHSHIFKNNAFDVWESMYSSFDINEKSRTDVKFMYEKMRKDGLVFETVNQKAFLDWVSNTYQIVVQKTSNYSETPERISIYSNAKQLYKAKDT